jgi:hypothetical protein
VNIIESTASYERWLKGYVRPVAKDVRLKHQWMRDDAFLFFRATFYRWAQIWPTLPLSLVGAPSVLGIGDSHVENFGTWRDREGRLVWGVNDFDESTNVPYTNDLIRLAVSGLLVRDKGLVKTSPGKMCDALLQGYRAALERGGAPFVIEERNDWLRALALGGARSPDKFWAKLIALDPWRRLVPRRPAELIHDVPGDAHQIRIVHRTSGAGSLGRPRFAALFSWRGGYMAREAKARVPSAWLWADTPAGGHDESVMPRVWKRAVRCQDPYLRSTRHWIARRLAPDCSRIDFADLPKKRQEIALFRAMGWEIANVHLGSKRAKALLHHLASLDPDWLNQASGFMHVAVVAEFRQWKRRARQS